MKPKRIIARYKKTKKSSLIVYLVLRLLVIICIIMQFIQGNYDNVFLATFSLLLFTLPTIIQDKFKIHIPNLLESIIYLFIFSSEILGEINNFYGIIPYWDTILHTLNGFLCAGIGFSLVDLLNKNSKNINLSPLYLAIVAFCFSMTVGVMWEFFEYGADKIFSTDMQKDRIVYEIDSVYLNPMAQNVPVNLNGIDETKIILDNGEEIVIDGYLDIGLNDTMKDLIVNFIGAVVFSIFGYFYVKQREKKSFIKNFLVKKLKDDNVKKENN